MPTYEYRCRACEHRFERFQKISDPPVKTCPSCGKRRVERLISSGGGIVFKGSGFYATDYRKDSPKTSDDGASSAEGSGSSTGSDASGSGSKGSTKDSDA